jgi:hypothetical protein
MWLCIYNEDRGGLSMSTIHPTKPEAVPLYYAARLGFQDLVEHLIVECPQHVNARGGREMTPMHAVASGGHADILWSLQGHGADVGSRNNMARPHCMELRAAENSTLGSVYSNLVQISMREMRMIGPHCSMQYSMDIQSLLECYLNAGQ